MDAKEMSVLPLFLFNKKALLGKYIRQCPDPYRYSRWILVVPFLSLIPQLTLKESLLLKSNLTHSKVHPFIPMCTFIERGSLLQREGAGLRGKLDPVHGCQVHLTNCPSDLCKLQNHLLPYFLICRMHQSPQVNIN